MGTESIEQIGPPLGESLHQVERVLSAGREGDLGCDALAPAVVGVLVLAEADDPISPHHGGPLRHFLEEVEEFSDLFASRPRGTVKRLFDPGVGGHHDAAPALCCDSTYALRRTRWSPSSFFEIAATRGSITRRNPVASSSHVHSIRVPAASG